MTMTMMMMIPADDDDGDDDDDDDNDDDDKGFCSTGFFLKGVVKRKHRSHPLKKHYYSGPSCSKDG